MCVLAFFASWKSSVSASLARSRSAAGSVSFSASTTSLATSRMCLRNSRLVRKPCSWRSLIFSSRSPRAVNVGLPEVLTQASDQLDLDFSGTLAGFSIRKNLFQDVCIKHQRLDVIAHRFEVDVLIDQLDGLGAERVPQELAVATGWFHRLIDLRQPACNQSCGAQARVRRQGLPDGAERGIRRGEAVS